MLLEHRAPRGRVPGAALTDGWPGKAEVGVVVGGDVLLAEDLSGPPQAPFTQVLVAHWSSLVQLDWKLPHLRIRQAEVA